MVRDFDSFSESTERHHLWQFTSFELKKKKMLQKSQEWADKQEFNKATALYNEANNLRFVFDRSKCLIQYGDCSKFGKPVTFIPETLQLETQECFSHRLNFKNNG